MDLNEDSNGGRSREGGQDSNGRDTGEDGQDGSRGGSREGGRDSKGGGSRQGGQDSSGGGTGEGRMPGWWPYGWEFPRWQVWRGVDRLYYANLDDADPAVHVRGEDPVDLRDQIRAHLLRPAP